MKTVSTATTGMTESRVALAVMRRVKSMSDAPIEAECRAQTGQNNYRCAVHFVALEICSNRKSDHISAQTQTISDLTRALTDIAGPDIPIDARKYDGQDAVTMRQIARAALSSAQSVSTEEER